MTSVEWVHGARFTRAQESAAPGGERDPAPPAVHRLSRALEADHVSLLRVEPATDRLRVAAVAGVPFVGRGMELPLSECPLVARALAGDAEVVEIDDVDGPLAMLARACGLRTATTAPLARVGAAALISWAASGASAPGLDEVRAAVVAEQGALERAVRLSSLAGSCVLVCHEDALTAEGVARRLERRLGVTAVACASLDAAIEAVHRQPPDVIACSEHLGTDDLADVATQVRAAGAAAPLVGLARAESAHSVATALRAGIAGYVPLDGGPEQLVDVVASVLDGRSVLPDAPPDLDGLTLTAREMQVLRGFDRGLSYVAIARELHVAPSTVKSHSRHLFRKLGVGSRTAALHQARQEGLL